MCSYFVNNQFKSMITLVPQKRFMLGFHKVWKMDIFHSICSLMTYTFFTETFLSNYADNNNLHSIGNDLDLIKQMLHKDFSAVTEWF